MNLSERLGRLARVERGVGAGIVVIALSSSLGAVLVDRAYALHPKLTLVPWTPAGRAGALAIARF